MYTIKLKVFRYKFFKIRLIKVNTDGTNVMENKVHTNFWLLCSP